MRRVKVLVSLAMTLVCASAAAAQTRTPAERQTLSDLAYVLGRSHALRQVCAGASDQYWRARMQQLIATEQPDPALDRQLELAFNAGFAAAQAAFPRCDAAARREQANAAERGHELAVSLSQPVAEDEPAQ
jgi:uncharacterized protein (TIGR02301 family)